MGDLHIDNIINLLVRVQTKFQWSQFYRFAAASGPVCN